MLELGYATSSFNYGLRHCTELVSVLPGEIPIEELDLGVRAYNLLKRAGFHSADHLSGFLFKRGALALSAELTEVLRDSLQGSLKRGTATVGIRTMQEISEAADYFDSWKRDTARMDELAIERTTDNETQ